MRQLEHRAHLISVSVSRTQHKVKIETEISLPAETDARIGASILAGDTNCVTAIASEDIEQEACEAAQRIVNVLIAESAASSRSRR